MYDLDVRRAYVLGTEFDKRMYDLYIGVANGKKPPYLDNLFLQETSMQAALSLENNKHLFEEKEWNDFMNAVWDDDSIVKFEVLERCGVERSDAILESVFVYLDFYHLPYLIRSHTTQPLSLMQLINSPAAAVW